MNELVAAGLNRLKSSCSRFWDGRGFRSRPLTSTGVILSGLAAWLSEAAAHSKDPYSQVDAEVCGYSFAANPKNRNYCAADRGPSTPGVHSQANEQPPLRMTTRRYREICRSGFLQSLKSCALVFAAALREIFDESAYARFLNQKQLVSSRSAYAAFRQEYEGTKARRPRCC